MKELPSEKAKRLKEWRNSLTSTTSVFVVMFWKQRDPEVIAVFDNEEAAYKCADGYLEPQHTEVVRMPLLSKFTFEEFL